MNRKFCALLAGCCLASASATAFATGNVLCDPGFESDASGENQNIIGWTTYGATAFNESGATAHSGNNYFKVFSARNGTVNYDGVYQDYISGPGATYTADAWAQTLSSDVIAGGNVAWVEVTFRDANANMLALYRTSLINNSATQNGSFPKSTWNHLFVTNQYDPNTFAITNTTSSLVAPDGTYFVRCQIVFQGDAANSHGSVYFDDLSLNLTSALPYGNWNIVWSDEFNGTNINRNTWTYDTGAGGWGNNELENYTANASNSYETNGLLHIVVQKSGGPNFTSARMKTQGLAAFLYGRFEWRVSLPSGTGFWPAVWFLGTNIDSGVGWPGCGEIDVVENNGASPDFVQGSLHSGSDETAIYNFLAGDSTTNFHTYVLDWSTNSFIWYVDGHAYEMQTGWGNTVGQAYPAPFNQPEFMLFDFAVGGNYVNNPSAATIASNTFPAQMLIDYARVYNTTAPLKLAMSHANNQLTISWPSNVVGHLQTQSNSGFNNLNWSDLTTSNNPATLPPTNTSAFFRLKSP